MFEAIRQNLKFFILLWFIVFLGSFLILSALGLAPNLNETAEKEKSVIPQDSEVLEKKLAALSAALPRRVTIDKIGVDTRINNPESRNIDVLDDSLSSGAVRYPTSGLLAEKTNMLLFGHSSNLPIVRNKSFQAFNDLEDMEIGEDISVFSDTHEFIYRVNSVEEADAENALVVFESDKREITLSTCNTFGNLNDRFVVKAELIDVRAI